MRLLCLLQFVHHLAVDGDPQVAEQYHGDHERNGNPWRAISRFQLGNVLPQADLVAVGGAGHVDQGHADGIPGKQGDAAACLLVEREARNEPSEGHAEGNPLGTKT